MIAVTYLSANKNRRKYNEVVQKKLTNTNIKNTLKSKKSGWDLLVSQEDYMTALKIILSVSLTNPR